MLFQDIDSCKGSHLGRRRTQSCRDFLVAGHKRIRAQLLCSLRKRRNASQRQYESQRCTGDNNNLFHEHFSFIPRLTAYRSRKRVTRPLTLMSKIESQCSSVIEPSGAYRAIPAFANTISSLPFPVMKTYAPWFTNCFAVARPMPLLPRLTSASFPSSLPIYFSFAPPTIS